jgi:hypothetical protein
MSGAHDMMRYITTNPLFFRSDYAIPIFSDYVMQATLGQDGIQDEPQHRQPQDSFPQVHDFRH